MQTDTKIAFIGLGVMGGPMAAHLANSGFSVTAYNRTASRAETWHRALANDGKDVAIAATPAEAASGADVVITCVGNDDDLAEVMLGNDGALGAMAAGSLYIDHTTVSADMARRLDRECSERNIAAVDAPVSGGQAGAENGALAIMCGGSAEAMARATRIMQPYAKNIVHVGGAGAGQTTKMANQMCIAGVLGGLSEAIRLAQGAGLDTGKVLEAISGGAAQSWQMENRWETMTRSEFDFGFALDWMRKDLGYALAEADRLGLESPVSRMVDGFYAELQADGYGRLDTSALIKRLPKSDPQGTD